MHECGSADEETGWLSSTAPVAASSCDHVLDAPKAVQKAEPVWVLRSGLTPLSEAVTHLVPHVTSGNHRNTPTFPPRL